MREPDGSRISVGVDDGTRTRDIQARVNWSVGCPELSCKVLKT